MGAGQTTGRSQSGMKSSIANYELKVKNSKGLAIFAAFLCALGVFAGNVFAQTLSPSDIENQAQRLNSTNEETRRDALHQLRVAETESASRAAARALNDKSEIVRATAPFSVLNLPADEAAQLLLPQLRDKSEYVRRETAYALGKTRSPRAAQPLIEVLQKDKRYSVRCAAAVALGEIGDLAAVNPLVQVLRKAPKEDEEFLRRAAARAVGEISETTLQREFFAQNQVKDFDLFVLRNRRSLTEKFPALHSAVEVLMRTLQNSSEADDVKREAAFALGAVGDLRAVSLLQIALSAEDNYLAEISREALKKILAEEKN